MDSEGPAGWPTGDVSGIPGRVREGQADGHAGARDNAGHACAKRYTGPERHAAAERNSFAKRHPVADDNAYPAAATASQAVESLA